MNRKNKFLFAILIIFIAIQSIQPARNIEGKVLQTDISHSLNVPQNIYLILKNSCYDCHNNNIIISPSPFKVLSLHP